MNNITEHKINYLDNFICGWYQSDTSICDKLIEHWNVNPKKIIGKIGTGEHTRVDKTIKDSVDVYLEQSVNQELWLEYHKDFLQPVTNLYCEKYEFANLTDKWSSIETPSIQKYDPGGGFFKWHCERSGVKSLSRARHLAFMTYLNTVEDGGETEFYYQKLKVKPEKGLTLIWPVEWNFTHRGVASMTETKMIITGWYSYVE